MDHVSLLISLCALAVIVAAMSVLLMQLDSRVRRLERLLLVHLPEYETMHGTANVHRLKLGWRVRVVMWLVGFREKLARWIEP